MTAHFLFIAPTRIGDAVLATSVLAEQLRTHPHATFDVVASPFSAPLFEGLPGLHRLLVVNKQRASLHWLNILAFAMAKRYSAVYDMRGSATAYFLRTKQRFIFKAPLAPMPKVNQYEVAFGTGSLPYPTLWTRPEDEAFVAALLPPNTPILALAPIANWPPKEWPLPYFITLANELIAKHQGLRPMIVCAAHERQRALPLLQALAAHHPIDLTTGEAHLLSIYASFKRSHVFVGNDSGLMHMAAASGIRTYGLFGPTPSEIYQPWGSQAHTLCAPKNDLQHLTPEMVLGAIMAEDN
jgi:heptosyltransferase III